MQTITKTGFYVSLVSYGVFWMLDVLRPGFVTRSFPIHLFLLSILFFGVLWGIQVREFTDRPWVQLVIVLILGIVLAVITWISGAGFGGIRVLMTLLALYLPYLFWKLIR